MYVFYNQDSDGKKLSENDEKKIILTENESSSNDLELGIFKVIYSSSSIKPMS